MLNPALRLKGSNSDVAKHFNISDEAIRLWKLHGIPTDRALDVEEFTKGEITAGEILQYARDASAPQKKRRNGQRKAA